MKWWINFNEKNVFFSCKWALWCNKDVDECISIDNKDAGDDSNNTNECAKAKKVNKNAMTTVLNSLYFVGFT